MPPLRAETGPPERFLIEVGRLGEALVDPRVHDPDPVSHQLDLVDPHLEFVVMAQRVDLLLRALNQYEAAQFRGLRLEDSNVEALDLPAVCKALEVAPGLV